MSDFKMNVGNAEIVALSDMSFPFPTPLADLFPKVPAEAWIAERERFPDMFDDDRMLIEIGCYLVRSLGRTILIDTGYGPGPIDYVGGLRGLLMADLASNRIDPAAIDTVFMSHLHLDHVGWNTTDDNGRLIPTFPNARYVAHQADLDHFRRSDVQAAARYNYMDRFIEPLVDLGVFDAIAEDTDLTGEVRALHTPGHTPGHMSILVSSGGQKALIQGDVLVHPSQVMHEDWNAIFDGDWDVATQTRRRILEQVEADGTPVISCHFPLPGLGRVLRYEGRRYWQAGL